MKDERRGGCLCGAVRYAARGPLRDVIACHCGQCRRALGHFGAATACARADFRLISGETLAWFDSSPGVRRGFCGRCGGNLFWDRAAAPHISIWAGTLDDGGRGLVIRAHIYTADKGAYYEICDGAPQWPGDNP